MTERELVVLDVKPGGAMESQSGLMMKWPRIYGGLGRAADKTAAIVLLSKTKIPKLRQFITRRLASK